MDTAPGTHRDPLHTQAILLDLTAHLEAAMQSGSLIAEKAKTALGSKEKKSRHKDL